MNYNISVFLRRLIKSENEILELIDNLESQVVISYFDQRCFNLFYENSNYRELIHTDRIKLYADGTGIRFAFKQLLKMRVKVFNSSDLNTKIFGKFIKESKRIFIVGSKFNTDWISKEAKKRHLNLCGYQNGYFDNTEVASISKVIYLSCPEVIIIGMGVPKQELLAIKLLESTRVKLILCVGNYLEYYLGTMKRAPKLLRNSGFEWIYRLLSEPRKLWHRYLVGIPTFIMRIIFEKFKLQD